MNQEAGRTRPYGALLSVASGAFLVWAWVDSAFGGPRLNTFGGVTSQEVLRVTGLQLLIGGLALLGLGLASFCPPWLGKLLSALDPTTAP